MFKNLTIKTRLIFVIGLLSVLLVGIGAIGLVGMNKANDGLLEVYQSRMVPMGDIAAIRNLLMRNRLAIAVAQVTPTPEEIKRNTDLVEKNIAEITGIWEKYIAGVSAADEKKLADKFAEDRRKFVTEGLRPAVAALRANNIKEATRIVVEAVRPHYVPVGEGIDALMKLQRDVAKQEYEQAQSRYATIRNLSLIAVTLGVLLALVIGFFLVRAVVRPLAAAIGYFEEIGKGNYKSNIEVHAHDETGKVLEALKAMQTKLDEDVTTAKRLADETMRIKLSLDASGTATMIADPDGKIIYLNREQVNMFKKAEDDLRKMFPNFNANDLIGKNIDMFHKNPAHQRNLLANLSAPLRAEIPMGPRTFNVVATPVMNEQGQRLGVAAGWVDRTAEVAIEKEVGAIVAAAANGDFTKRIEMQGKDGFFKLLGENINHLLETSATGMNEVVRVLSALAKGDLTEKIVTEYQGTFGQLKNDSNLTVEKLTEIVTQIKESTDAINTASKEIAAGNSDLSQRTEEQASSLEETASSMEELTSTVKQNAENAKQANQLAIGASDVAVKGGGVVGQVVTTMSSINDSSKKIVDIISVIDGIAFQTNILALNAAVEAARAGEQGRGFAVVATEVRNLAQRSAAAAKEIKTLISDSVEKVGAGTKLVDEAGKTMEEIVTSIKRVTDIMSEITAASQEQSAGIEQVNQAITQMDEVTQQNAALVEQAAAAAESLEEQAQNLANAVSVFRLGSNVIEGSSTRVAERREVGRPANVARLPAKADKAKPAAAAHASAPKARVAAAAGAKAKVAGGEDDWKEF